MKTALAENLVESIQIAGGEVYEGARWREAILAYLNGVWANDVVVMHRPTIAFNDIVLDMGREKYVGYYSSEFPNSGRKPSDVAYESLLLIPDPTYAEVERSLVRFVKNNQIRQLLLGFPIGGGYLYLIKGRKRSELFVSTAGNFQSQKQYAATIGYDI